MSRARPPVWLARPGRFAGVPPVAAVAVALAALLLIAASWFVPADDGGTASVAGQTDLGLYAAIVEGVRGGGDYYTVAAQALRAGGYPLKPFVTFRLPTLAVVQAALPNLLVLALLAGVAAATVLTWRRVIEAWFARGTTRAVAWFLLAGGMIAFVQPGLVAFHEIWAGLLIAWALALRSEERWIEAAAIALCAMLIRETAALFALAMLAAALIERQRREAIGWGAVLLVFVAILSLHARAAGIAVGPLDPVSPGWTGGHGPGLFANAMARSTVLTLLPWWIGAPVAMLALTGWAAAPGPVGFRAALTFGGYALAIALFARIDNFYWVLAAAPAFLVGLAFLPDAARDLAVALLDRRRVRVQRIVR
ncbi:hypothetical protein [Sphingomonas sp. Leaf25]|uniref:hypothetical protein n=1 Tax=Sphingomonas sp. Leaf25 TaxID=1735692 RepID=UPI0007011A8A|nr:hypothetical protein [Sphingomonas sp. Leaf25]KQN07239.1 hypothetical protein ASE78_13575 [Sphingomonas sp. Leaf25]